MEEMYWEAIKDREDTEKEAQEKLDALNSKVEAKRADLDNMLVSNSELTSKLAATSEVLKVNKGKLAVVEKANEALVRATGSNKELAENMAKLCEQNENLVTSARSVSERNNLLIDRLMEAATGLSKTVATGKDTMHQGELQGR